MTPKGPLNLVELHVEKLVLGLAVVWTVVVAVLFLTGPNRVEYGGQPYGPGELDEAIASRAQALKQKINGATENVEKVPRFSEKLQEQFRAGLGLGTDLPATLPRSTTFGAALPELRAERAAIQDLALVTPLPPTRPVTRTGISLVYRTQASLGEAKSAAPEEEPVERSWVTVAGYFPALAQTREMTAKGYEGYRAKVFIAGADVQRQEMTASGEFSAWADVEPCPAMPRVDIPTPVYDQRTGDVLNQADLERALDLVRTWQMDLAQPDFYRVDAGDHWDVPPLDEEESGAERQAEPPGGGAVPPAEPPTPGQPPAPPGGEPPTPGALRDARERIRQALADARGARREKKWAEVVRLVEPILNDPLAGPTDKRAAQRLLDEARSYLNEPAPTAGQPQTTGERPLVLRDNEDRDPAVWFHDDTVEPGKTYRYRLRVKLWNRYVGKRAMLANAAEADDAVLAGDWSLPSDPITVAPKLHFFVQGPRPSEVPTAGVDVFVWHAGQWYKESFTVQVGDVIGEVRNVRSRLTDASGRPVQTSIDFTTGALVLDIRPEESVLYRTSAGRGMFNYGQAKSLVLVYLDPVDGQVKERIDREDRADAKYTELKKEAGS